MEDERDENIVYVTPDMHKKVLDVCEIQRDRVLLRCLWQLGARPSEISNIKLSDVDRDRKEVKLVTKKQDDTKTRYVPYKSSLEFELTEWIDSGKRQSYGPIKWENEHEVSEEGYLINTQRSKKMSADQIQKRVRELCERANVGGVEYTREQLHPQGQTGKMDVTKRKYRSISSKSWRHGFAMRAMDANMPIPYISYLLGHESTEITTEMYLHVNRNEAYNAYRQYL